MVSSTRSVSFSSVLVVPAHGSSSVIAWSVRAPVSTIATASVISFVCTHCKVIEKVACDGVGRLNIEAASAGDDAKSWRAAGLEGPKLLFRSRSLSFLISGTILTKAAFLCFHTDKNSEKSLSLSFHLANEKFGVIFTILYKTLILHLVVLSSELLPARA
jgi:hypothetical protein